MEIWLPILVGVVAASVGAAVAYYVARDTRLDLEQDRSDQVWTQLGRRSNTDGSIVEYPSFAANSNDPAFGRGGYHTVARQMKGKIPTSEWRRVFPQDEKALRNED
jgi:hypothetical protein